MFTRKGQKVRLDEGDRPERYCRHPRPEVRRGPYVRAVAMGMERLDLNSRDIQVTNCGDVGGKVEVKDNCRFSMICGWPKR